MKLNIKYCEYRNIRINKPALFCPACVNIGKSETEKYRICQDWNLYSEKRKHYITIK